MGLDVGGNEPRVLGVTPTTSPPLAKELPVMGEDDFLEAQYEDRYLSDADDWAYGDTPEEEEPDTQPVLSALAEFWGVVTDPSYRPAD